MGQTDLASNSLTSHPDVFADIINTIIYKGRTVLEAENLKPFYVNSTITKSGRLRGLYRDNCMEDLRGGIRYVIWGLENQYVPDRTTPFKVMGYNFTAYDRQIEAFAAYNKKHDIHPYVAHLLPEQKSKASHHTGIVLWQRRNTRQHLCHDGYPRGYKYQKVYSRLQTKPYQTAQAFEKAGKFVSVRFSVYCKIFI